MVYLRRIFALTVFSLVLENLSPDNSSSKKALRRITSLLVLLAIMSPLSNVVELVVSLPNIDGGYTDTDTENRRDEFTEIFIAETKLKIERNVKTLLSSRYSVPLEAIDVSCEVNAEDSSSVKLVGVYITISESSLPLNLDSIAEYVSDQLGCKCYVSEK